MSDEVKEIKPSPMKRRTFFGYLAATVTGGFLIGSLIRRILGTKSGPSDQDQPIRISTNSLAVPRTKEGSRSHV